MQQRNLPPYDVKKPQKMMSSLKKKKFGFKKSKQKTAMAPVMAPEISSLSIVDAGPGILLFPV